jgi:hypothetical protein
MLNWFQVFFFFFFEGIRNVSYCDSLGGVVSGIGLVSGCSYSRLIPSFMGSLPTSYLMDLTAIFLGAYINYFIGILLPIAAVEIISV